MIGPDLGAGTTNRIQAMKWMMMMMIMMMMMVMMNNKTVKKCLRT